MADFPFNLLDKCHISFDYNAKYTIYEIDARELLTYQRFDLYANLIYIDHKTKNIDMEWGTKVYFDRTNAITNGKLSEPGNDKKNDFGAFLETFDNLIESFKTKGFDETLSLVPIDKNMVLIDGAHRVSCAAYFNRKVSVVQFFCEFKKQLTFSFFDCQQRLYAPNTWDAMALEYCKWHKDSYILFIWPKVHKSIHMDDAVAEIKKTVDVVYHKTMKLHYKGYRNLILQIYNHVPWLGSLENKFKWTWTKTDEIFNPNGVMEIYVVKAPSIDVITNLKLRLRDIFNIGIESVHSTDNHIETMRAANVLFNENSIHFIENGDPDKFEHTYKLFERYKRLIIEAGGNFNDYIIDSSISMGLYGIRDAHDLDYLTTSFLLKEDNTKTIENHTKAIENHTKTIEDLIYNPKNYFVFNELKIISLPTLREFKQKRNSKKDRIDIALIHPYLKKSGFRWTHFRMNANSKLRIWGIKAKSAAITASVKILHTLKLYQIVRLGYRKLK